MLITSRPALSSAIFIVHSRRRHSGRAMWKRTLRIALIGIYPVVCRSDDAHSPSPSPYLTMARVKILFSLGISLPRLTKDNTL